MMHLSHLLLVSSLALSIASIFSADEEGLHFSDVKAMMNQVLSQHIDHKKISTEIIAQSFWNFIDRFDPEKIYLLESEVRPWMERDDLDWMRILSAYKKNEFQTYEQLNQVIQESVRRSREIRIALYQNPDLLFSSNPLPLAQSFAQTTPDLKSRIQDVIVAYIAKQKEKFGVEAVMKKKQVILAQAEKLFKSHETDYLYVDPQGYRLSDRQQESLLVLHILKSLAKSLDHYTAFYDKAEAYDMKVRLEKGMRGVGLFFEEGLEGVVVDDTLQDSPASRSGKIRKGDRLVAINDENVKDRTLEDVVQMIHLAGETEVALGFEREESGRHATYTVTLQKEPIPVQETRVDTSYTYFGEGIIGTIVLHAFYEGEEGSSEKDVRDAIVRLQEVAPLEGLILDLRDNRGGYLTQAVRVAGLFITNGVVAISRYSDGSEKIYRDVDGKISFEGPLVILVSRETASAAEIVAQALQDYGVAIVVGDDHTFGKGTIQSQTVTDNEGSAFFKVTVGKYYTVSGKTPEQKGVSSDIVILGPRMLSGEEDRSLREVSSAPDHVPPEFVDDLSDVQPDARPWFLRYYVPHLQKEVDHWKKLLPILSKNSAARLKENKNYQLLLKKNQPTDEDADEEEDGVILRRPSNVGVNDIQHEEAVKIVQDMIRLSDEEKGEER